MNTEFDEGHKQALQQLLAIPLIWNATPEDFLTLIQMTEWAVNQMALPVTAEDKANGLIEATHENLAAAYLEVMIVDFSPYKDFADLIENGIPAKRLIEQGTKITENLVVDEVIDEAIEDTGVVRLPGGSYLETFWDLWVKGFIDRTSKQIKFDDDDLYQTMFALQLNHNAETDERLLNFPFTWNNTPEAFLELIIELENLANHHTIIFTEDDRHRQLVKPTVDNLAAAIMKITHVNLWPYKSFEDLKRNGTKSNILANNAIQYARKMVMDMYLYSINSGLFSGEAPNIIKKDLTFIWADFFIITAGLNLKFQDLDYLVKSLIAMLSDTKTIGVAKSLNNRRLDKMIHQYQGFR